MSVLKSLLFAVLFYIPSVVFGQKKPLVSFTAKEIILSNAELSSRFKKFNVLKIESQKLSEFVHRENVSSFRLNLGGDKDWDLDLQPSSLATTKYRLKILSPLGVQTISSRPDFLFKGKVRGSSKDEEVRLSIKDGFIYGSIQAGGKEYFIEPLNRFINTRQKDEYIIYEAKDVVSTASFACGFKDKENSMKEAESQNNLREHSPQDAICKKIKFISVADYSIYQKFGEDVYAVETALLSNLNLAEGAFTTLNLGADGSTDVGTDRLQFEMEEIVVSTCKECDIISGKESSPDLGQELSAWLQKFYPDKGNSILQFWTTRTLFSLDGLFIGGVSYSTIDCSGPPARQILKYHSDDPGFLRMLIAHETGHLLGCRHDDQVKPDVKGFIMQTSIANPTLATRFSTLADFGGVNYSSQKAMHDFTNFRNCLPDCQTTSCEPVKDLKITYFNSADSIRLSWSGSGTFQTRYKILDSVNFDNINIHEITGNNITLKKLEPCNLYLVEVQKKCSDSSYGQITSVVLNTSSLSATANPTNTHGDKYDLELNLNCRNCNSKEYVIKIDNHPFSAPNNSAAKQIVIKDLFADGARHRIDIAKVSSNKECVTTSFYNAPYYRSNSTNILSADFNNCVTPPGWKDTLLAKAVASQPNAQWLISDKNSFTINTFRGNFDNTCMLSYNRSNSFGQMYSGAVSLTSPAVDLTRYENLQLHFDYNFLSHSLYSSKVTPVIYLDVYDGVRWTNIFKRSADLVYPNTSIARRDVWDSIPTRVFINLDKYKSEKFQIRLIADDGSLAVDSSGYLFAAFDNIQVDGYLKNLISADNIIIYPNPVKEEIFVQFKQQPVENIRYCLFDASGRVINRGILINYRINLGKTSAGMYLLQLFNQDKLLLAKKILKP